MSLPSTTTAGRGYAARTRRAASNTGEVDSHALTLDDLVSVKDFAAERGYSYQGAWNIVRRHPEVVIRLSSNRHVYFVRRLLAQHLPHVRRPQPEPRPAGGAAANGTD